MNHYEHAKVQEQLEALRAQLAAAEKDKEEALSYEIKLRKQRDDIQQQLTTATALLGEAMKHLYIVGNVIGNSDTKAEAHDLARRIREATKGKT